MFKNCTGCSGCNVKRCSGWICENKPNSHFYCLFHKKSREENCEENCKETDIKLNKLQTCYENIIAALECAKYTNCLCYKQIITVLMELSDDININLILNYY